MKSIQSKLQTFSGAMMVPIILLVLVGFYVAIGASLTQYLIPEGNILHECVTLLTRLGFMFMNHLHLWFAVAIAFSLAKKEKGWAAFNGVVMFFCLLSVISNYAGIKGLTAETVSVDALIANGYSEIDAKQYNALFTTTMGFFGYDMGIFIGILSGLMAAFVHNKFVDVKFKPMFSFFEGVRFVIIMTTIVSIFYGILIFNVWPIIGKFLQYLTVFIANTQLFGTFVFGTLDKMLLPFGIHHLIAFPIEYSKVGGVMEVNGVLVEGVRNIINAQAGDPNSTGYIIHNFTTGRILFQLAGLPGAALAMYHAAKKENRKKIASLLVPAVITLMFVGISEPIEYTFLFVAPLLYFLVYAPLCGLCYVLAEVTGVSINGHALFFMIPNLFQPSKVHAMSLIYLLPLTFALYYFVFKFLIEKFDLKTPGRGDDEIKLMSKKEYREIKDGKENINSLEVRIIEALGGKDNISNITCCATRLRVELKDVNIVATDEDFKNHLEAMGVVRLNNNIQIIYGTRVNGLLTSIKDILMID